MVVLEAQTVGQASWVGAKERRRQRRWPGEWHIDAIELGEYNVRVNSIHPWGVATVVAEDPNVAEMLTAHPNYLVSFGCVLQTPFPAHVDDISDAVIYLASDLSRAVTATQLAVDMGATKD